MGPAGVQLFTAPCTRSTGSCCGRSLGPEGGPSVRRPRSAWQAGIARVGAAAAHAGANIASRARGRPGRSEHARCAASRPLGLGSGGSQSCCMHAHQRQVTAVCPARLQPPCWGVLGPRPDGLVVRPECWLHAIHGRLPFGSACYPWGVYQPARNCAWLSRLGLRRASGAAETGFSYCGARSASERSGVLLLSGLPSLVLHLRWARQDAHAGFSAMRSCSGGLYAQGSGVFCQVLFLDNTAPLAGWHVLAVYVWVLPTPSPVTRVSQPSPSLLFLISTLLQAGSACRPGCKRTHAPHSLCPGSPCNIIMMSCASEQSAQRCSCHPAPVQGAWVHPEDACESTQRSHQTTVRLL